MAIALASFSVMRASGQAGADIRDILAAIERLIKSGRYEFKRQ
jgi:hypothetical protein